MSLHHNEVRGRRTLGLLTAHGLHRSLDSPTKLTIQTNHRELLVIETFQIQNYVKAIQTYSGQIGVDPGKLIERTHNDKHWWQPVILVCHIV